MRTLIQVLFWLLLGASVVFLGAWLVDMLIHAFCWLLVVIHNAVNAT